MQELPETFTRADRDTIIRLDEKVDNLICAVKELKDNTVSRITQLETNKANQRDFAALHSRVETLEGNWKFVLGGFALIGIIATLIVYIYYNDLNHIKLDLDKHVTDTKELLK